MINWSGVVKFLRQVHLRNEISENYLELKIFYDSASELDRYDRKRLNTNFIDDF
jgi:hypothetical protein